MLLLFCQKLSSLDHLIKNNKLNNWSRKQKGECTESSIQYCNQALILDVAQDVFSLNRYCGSTLDLIARTCGLSKPNSLYPLRCKEDIYKALLERTMKDWRKPLQVITTEVDPVAELERTEALRLFADEILHGAPRVGAFLKNDLRKLNDLKVQVISDRVREGKLADANPRHLIFSIWAVTQHHADFSIQVEAVLGKTPHEQKLEKDVFQILLRGLDIGVVPTKPQ
jgi:TetR/AcrR family transcriptional regulator